MEENINNLMEEARSKTLCEDFDEQIEIAEELYGQQIRLKFNEKDVKETLIGIKRRHKKKHETGRKSSKGSI